MTLRLFSPLPKVIPMETASYLAALGEARGKQDFLIQKKPQRLKALREQALIESAVSSNRIEGVEVDQKRLRAIIFGKSRLQDRSGKEVRGYAEALKLMQKQADKLPFSEETIRHLHRLSRGRTGDAGQYKKRNIDIIEKFPDGRTRMRFRTVAPSDTPAYMAELVQLTGNAFHERWAKALVAVAACNLDFLCIHPFRDGNGRVSRLLLSLQLFQLGFAVGRYISLERLIEQSKDRYYETLHESSQGWHEGKHDPWRYINYLLYTLVLACREFEERVKRTTSPKGAVEN
jgi:Fic family protein